MMKVALDVNDLDRISDRDRAAVTIDDYGRLILEQDEPRVVEHYHHLPWQWAACLASVAISAATIIYCVRHWR